MRPKFVFTLLLSVTLVLGLVIFFKQRSVTTPESTTMATPPATASIAPAPAPAPALVAAQAPLVAQTVMTPDERQAAIDTEVDRLLSWGMNNDSASLSNILADLNSPEKEIRQAAMEAAKQFGSTNAIPALKAAVNNTDDPEEKIALLQAAEFLSLPDAVWQINDPNSPKTPEQLQAMAQMKAADDARRQARPSSQQQNQNPPPGPTAAPGQ